MNSKGKSTGFLKLFRGRDIGRVNKQWTAAWMTSVVLLIILVFASAPAVHAAGYTLKKHSDGQFFLYDDAGTRVTKGGWYSVNGKRRFFFNKSGRMATGWLTYSGQKYYLDKKTGVLVTGLKKIDGKYYYLNPGSNPPGKAAKGFAVINNRRYYFLSDNSMKTGWMTVNGKKYYFGSNGAQRQGLITLSGNIYVFDPADGGALARSKWVRVGGKLYYSFSNGRLNGWTGWRDIGGNRYYFTKEHNALTGVHVLNGVTCTFSSDGRLVNGGAASFTLYSDCAGLYEVSTGKPVFVKNPNTPHANASTTKIMTCLLALERSSLSDIVTASAYAASQEPTKIYLSAGERFYMKDLLYGLMLPSGNDAAVAIAEHVAGNVPAFLTMMNSKAKSLGCTSTHFETPNGLDAGYNHYTTVSDLARITMAALKNNTFRQIVNTRTYSFSTGYRSYYLTTTNALLGNEPGIMGVKTGYTRKAGHCFVGLVRGPSGKEYVLVVLGAPTSAGRWSDARTLASYAYSHQ